MLLQGGARRRLIHNPDVIWQQKQAVTWGIPKPLDRNFKSPPDRWIGVFVDFDHIRIMPRWRLAS
jgi:hypothetical protein